VSVRLRPGVLIDDAQLSIVNAATAETLVLQMNVQPNVRNAHYVRRSKDIPPNPTYRNCIPWAICRFQIIRTSPSSGPLRPDEPGARPAANGQPGDACEVPGAGPGAPSPLLITTAVEHRCCCDHDDGASPWSPGDDGTGRPQAAGRMRTGHGARRHPPRGQPAARARSRSAGRLTGTRSQPDGIR
jgi:hypothetical protein